MDWLAGSRQHILELLITRTLVLAPIYVLGFSKEVIDAYIVIVGFQAVFNHCQRQRAARAAALRDRHAQLPPLAPLARTTRRSTRTTPRTSPSSTTSSAPPCKTDRALARALRRGRRLRAERLLQAAEVSVRVEGLSADARCRRCASTPSSSAPAPPACSAPRIAGQRGLKVLLLDHAEKHRREDPHLRRRPLQLHQPRRPAPAQLPRRQPALLPLGAGALHAAATSSRWCSATASPSTRSTRASCSATARREQIIDMLLAECAAGGVTRWQPCAVHGGAPRRRRLRARHRRAARSRRARLVDRHRRPVDPEDRRQRLRLPPGAPVRPARRRAAPGAGAADLRRRRPGRPIAELAGPGAAGAHRDRRQEGAHGLPRRPAVHPPRPVRAGGAADLELLAAGRAAHASTWRPASTCDAALREAKAALAQAHRQRTGRAGAAPAGRRLGAARTPALAAPDQRSRATAPWPQLAERIARWQITPSGTEGYQQGRGHGRRRRHPRAARADLESRRGRACTSSARWST